MVLGLNEYEKQYEKDFRNTCETYAMYQADKEEHTLDGEWSEEELKADIYDVCVEVMTEQELKKYKYRALRNPDLLKIQYMAEHIKQQIDVIKLYNTEYDKHRHEKIFGIHWYDDALKKMILQELKDNLINK